MHGIKTILKQFLNKFSKEDMSVKWTKVREGSVAATHIKSALENSPSSAKSASIEALAEQTNALGPQPLWSGYGENNIAGPTRMPNGVRTTFAMGNFYANLITSSKPEVIVEFGTAFGVSSMYFLAGIESNGRGHLYTFEPNEIWQKQAVKNMTAVSNNFTSVLGTFEENVDRTLPQDKKIDLAFIDAIHTSKFVNSQLNLVAERSHPGAIIILDDINFSDDMRDCWSSISVDPRFATTVSIGKRVGIVEVR